MSKFTVKYTPHKIREIIKLKKQIETKKEQPYFGEIEGYKFVLNNIEDPTRIFKEYQKTHSKMK